jgi:hypothetical protein
MQALATWALLAGALARPTGGAPPLVADALKLAVPVPGGKVEVTEYRPTLPPGCAVDRAEVASPVTSSGQVPVHLEGRLKGGRSCDGWAWARVRLVAPVLVASRALREGEPLAGSVAAEERELVPGRLSPSQLGPDAVATRPLSAGQPLEEKDLRYGPAPGEPVVIAIQLGSLRVEEPGRSIPCVRDRACALTPTGKRVEGTWQGGRLIVSSP